MEAAGCWVVSAALLVRASGSDNASGSDDPERREISSRGTAGKNSVGRFCLERGSRPRWVFKTKGPKYPEWLLHNLF